MSLHPSAEATTRPQTGADTASPSQGLLCPADSEIDPLLSIVMPTLNEEAGIGACIDGALVAVDAMGIPAEIIVADSSTDRTPTIARDLGAIVVEPEGDGYGAAYRCGFAAARGQYVVMGDADCTYDFTAIPELLDPLVRDEADLVIGSRFAGDIEPGAMPKLHQYVGNPALTAFLNLFYDAGVTDAHSGFRAVRRSTLEELSCRADGMEFASEMVMDAAVKDVRIAEIPITYHDRVGEETLDSFRDGWRHVRFMLTNAPGYVFSLPAVCLLTLGLVVMAISLTRTQIAGLTFGLHTIIAGSLLTIVGYQVGSLAVFSTLAAEPLQKPRDPITNWITDNVRLEHGALLGTVLYGLGGIYVAWMVIRWVESGLTKLPFLDWNMVAFTAIVLGVQTVFSSFFLSMLAQE